ncbi:MAG: hypothetical protein HRF45_08120 [Fimbriimonadia bacterium]|jgi:beta propeller repeat protein
MFDRILFVLLALSCAGAAAAQQVVEFPISVGPQTEWQPSVSYGMVVWADDRSGTDPGFDIWGTDLRNPWPFPVCQALRDQLRPQIGMWRGAPLCVWEDYRWATGPDIWGLVWPPGSPEFPVAASPDPEKRPRCFGPNVVYELDSLAGFGPDVWACDLDSMQTYPVCMEPDVQRSPDVFGYKVVWSDNRPQPDGAWDLFFKDLRVLSAETNLTRTLDEEAAPAISGNWVVYEFVSLVGWDTDIYARRIDDPDIPPKPICIAPGDQRNPAIWGNIVVWEDYRYGAPVIMGYDLSTEEEFLISQAGGSIGADTEPDVSEGVVVWTRSYPAMGILPDVIGAWLQFSQIEGDIHLGHYRADPQFEPLELHLKDSMPPAREFVIPIRPDSNGHFVAVTRLSGLFIASLKHTHWLRQTLPGVYALQAGTTTPMSFQLINGDAVQDNHVNLIDLNKVLVEFGNPAPNDADLDGSGLVDLADLNIVLVNFGIPGDPW